MHIAGHQHTLNQLENMLAGGFFPHALLLHGPRGIGKATFARALAARLICGPAQTDAHDMFGTSAPQSPLAANPASPQFHQIAAGSCPDFHVLEREVNPKTKKLYQNIKIEDVRALLATLARSADTARVVVVDAVDDLSAEAANTLLKTLEEPRAGIYFVLVCHSLSRCLPTIRSRCRLLRLSPLTNEQTLEVLKTQNIDSPETLLTLAQGCPGVVVGEGATATAVAVALHDVAGYLEGRGPLPDTKNAAVLLDATQRYLVKNPSFSYAQAYTQLAQALSKAQEYNLPLPTLAEVTLTNLKAQQT
jgi:DNA polymerase III subunit delta'